MKHQFEVSERIVYGGHEMGPGDIQSNLFNKPI